MSYPSGPQGGFPGQGPQQPQGGMGYPPAPKQGGGLKLGLPQILNLALAGLGVLILFLGLAPMISYSGLTDADKQAAEKAGRELSQSFYDQPGTGWVPVVFLVAGLIALLVVLPGKQKPSSGLAAVIALAGTLGLMLTMFSTDFPEARSSGAKQGFGGGAVMILIFGILMTLVAIAAFLLDNEIVKMPAKKPAPYGAPGGYGPQSGGFPQPGQQQPGQQQPGQYGAPQGQPGQQTQFAPQQGQFGQPGGQQPGGHPGTPPGGYPQQG